MQDELPPIAQFRIYVETRSYDEATDWRRTWNETQTPETLHGVAINRRSYNADTERMGCGLEFICSTLSQFEAVSGFIHRMHPRG